MIDKSLNCLIIIEPRVKEQNNNKDIPDKAKLNLILLKTTQDQIRKMQRKGQEGSSG
jgi:hypothetical protein